MSNKYHAKRMIINGYQFDSIKESQRYAELQLLLKAGKIELLTIHPRFKIIDGFEWCGQKIRPTYYIADFMYWDGEVGRMIVEDVKALDHRTGKPIITPEAKIKIKLFKWQNLQYEFRIVT
jgi:hypothetical protein